MNTFITAVERKEITLESMIIGDPVIESQSIEIYWNLELEMRKWGIKEMTIYIQSVLGSFEVYDDCTEEKESETFFCHDFTVEYEGTEDLNTPIYIQDVIIDLDDKVITVDFS